MRWSVSLSVLLAGCGGAPDRPPVAPPPPRAEAGPIAPRPRPILPPEFAATDGPAATSGEAEDRYDAVGYASWYGEELNGNRTATGEQFDPAGISAAHRTLPLDSFAEITALDTGRTILVRINDRGPGRRDREIDLSRGAADLLGTKGAVAAVRVRSVTPGPGEAVALRAGRAASPRMDAPQGLLIALRKGLRGGYRETPPPPRVVAPPRAPRPDAPRPVGAVATGRYAVQVAAFSNEARARALAATLGGTATPAGALWRVRLGPFADAKSAERARDAVARRGYGDATILTDP